jgi:hypothetical protein
MMQPRSHGSMGQRDWSPGAVQCHDNLIPRCRVPGRVANLADTTINLDAPVYVGRHASQPTLVEASAICARTRRLHRNKYRVDQLTGGLARQGAVLFSCPLETEWQLQPLQRAANIYLRPSPCHQYIGRHAPVTTVTGPAVAASTASPQEVPASVPEAYS